MASLFTLNATAAPSAFDSLPEDTMMALRINATRSNIANMKDSTQFGKIVFDQKRLDGIKAAFESYLKQEGEYNKYRESLSKLGLEDKEITDMIYSRFGVAFGFQEMSANKQSTNITMWIKNEQALIDKLFSGMQNSIESSDSEKRVDMEIAGRPSMMMLNKDDSEVSQIINAGNGYLIAIVGVPNANLKMNKQNTPSTDDEADFEAQSFSPFFFKNSAISMASSLSVSAASAAVDLESFAQIQENVNRQASQFLESLDSQGSSFYQNTLASPGMRSNKPSGNNFIEVVGNLKNMPLTGKQKTDFAKMGQLSSFGAWMTYEDNQLNSKAFMSLPESKRGYLELLNQPPLDGQPANWVPADIQSYSQMSFDLPKLWTGIKAIIEAEKPGTSGLMEQKANQQLQMMLQTDLNALLGSFGKVMHVVELPADTEAKNPLGMGRVAFVLDFENEALIQKLVMTMKGMAGMMMPGAINDSNLLGFNGIKLNEQFTKGQSFSLYHGNKKLIICLGNSDEFILSALKNPPSGQDQLIENNTYRDFMSNKHTKDSVIFSYNNAAKAINDLMDLFEQADLGAQIEKQANLKGMEKVYADLKKLLPKRDEVSNIFGQAMTQIRFTNEGLLVESISELPPAK